MKLATKLFMLGIALVLGASATGCGVATTRQENNRIIARTFDYDAKEMVDDLNLLLQVDRPLRTSRWIID